MDRSLHGWRRWVQNLGFMAEFSIDELREMEQGLTPIGRAFIENDLEITKRHQAKIPQTHFRIQRQELTADSSGMVA